MTLSLVAVFAALASLACGASYQPPTGGYQPPTHVGYQPPTYRQQTYYPPPPPPSGDVLDEGDKLNARLASVSDRLNFQQERFASLNQRLSLARKFLDTFTKVYLAEIKANDEVQDSSISIIKDEATTTAHDLEELETALDDLETANSEGAHAQIELSDAITRAVKVNVRQNAQITELHVKISDLKNKLLQVLNNVLQVFQNKVSASETVLNGAVATEKRRMCETGRIIFGIGFVEHSFQSPFDGVPSVTVGLCDARFDLNVRPPVSKAYSYGPPPTEPSSLGLQFIHYATENALIIVSYERSFGDVQSISSELCYMACTITPNIFYPSPQDHGE